jgi:hypothetical protein
LWISYNNGIALDRWLASSVLCHCIVVADPQEPLLPWAINQWHLAASDTSKFVKQLLSAGYNPLAVPMDMCEEPLSDPHAASKRSFTMSKAAKEASA